MRRALEWTLGASAIAAGFLNIMRLRWVGDDAFITFRYADNWLAGLGVVYNPGERVEGYTHFLWLCAITLLRRLGADPVAAAEWLGIAAGTGTIALFVFVSWTLFGTVDDRTTPRLPVIPFTAIVLALHYDFDSWGTGGLETAAFTLLLAAAFYIIAVRRSAGSFRPAAGGLIMALATMTRPDGLLLLVATVPFVAAQTRSVRRVLTFLLGAAVILTPYIAWKHAYYGSILPNTYYTKSANLSWWSQGFVYLWLYFRAYWSSLLFLAGIPMGVAAIIRKRGTALSDPVDASLLLALTWVLAYLILFVARIGGDFMYARFVVPMIPFLYITVEIVLRRTLTGCPKLLAPSLLLLPLVFMAQAKISRDAIFFDSSGKERSSFGPYGVTDERWYYTHDLGAGRSLIQGHREIGEQLAVYFAGTEVSVIQGGQASLVYYGRFRTCIDRYGLTDRTVARLPLAKRTRPGHEKIATVEYLISRGVQFEFLRRPFRNDPYRLVYFRVGDSTVEACLVTYPREIMRHLRERFPEEVQSVDFEAYLDDWLAEMPSKTSEEVRRDYEDFRTFYFEGNPDPAREGKILARLNGG